MNNQSFDLELLDKYIAGTISESELTSLSGQFETPEDLEREAELHRHFTSGIKSAGNREAIANLVPNIEQKLEREGFFEEEKQNQPPPISSIIDKIEKKLEQEGFYEQVEDQKPKGKVLNIWLKVAAAAAIILIPVAYLFFPNSNQLALALEESSKLQQAETTEYLAYLQEKIDDGTVGYAGETTGQLKQLQTAISEYQKGKTTLASVQLAHFHEANPQNETAAFYLALCHMETEDYEKANSLLSLEIYQGYQDNAIWLKALCLLKLGREQQAERLIIKLTKGNSEFAERAERLK